MNKCYILTYFISISNTQSMIEVRNSEKRLSDLAQNQEALEIRIEKLRERYRSQYAAMESQIASLNETGDMLKAAFAQKDN